MRFLIACSGHAKRWENYMGVPKHLIEINGERLLDRTIRLIRNKADKNDKINVVAFKKIYKTPYSTLRVPRYEIKEEKEKHFEYPFLYVSKKWWSVDDTTVILLGDVYFTEEAMNTIINNARKSNQYAFYGRDNASTFTGCSYGEIFGISISHESVDTVWNTILEVKHLKETDQINRFSGWEIYRQLQSINPNSHEIKDNFIIIDDFTDDFDYPSDYDLWIAKWTEFASAKYDIDQLNQQNQQNNEIVVKKKTNPIIASNITININTDTK